MLYIEIKESEEKDFCKRYDINMQSIKELDTKAREKGTLLHRFIYEPYADGKAIYQITRVNKKTVRIKLCTGIGDDYMIPYWGEETLIDRDFAEKRIEMQDWFYSLRNKK